MTGSDRRRRLLVLGAGRHQAPLIRRAESLGIETIAIDPYETSPGKQFATHSVLGDAFDVSVAVEAARRFEIDGVTTIGTDQTVLVVARVAAELGLPCHVSPEGALRATNKPVMREALLAHGVAMPEAVVVTDDSPPVEPPAYPCVVKAADSQGQRGMTVVQTPDQLPHALSLAKDASRTRVAVVERFRVGPEFTINAWMNEGDVESVAVLDRITFNPPPHIGICMQHVGPSVHAADLAELTEIARAVARAYDQRNGPLYIQTLATDDGYRVVEAASRIGGGHEAQLLPRHIGFDPIPRAIELALGLPPTPTPPVAGSAGLVTFVVAQPGTLATLGSMAELVEAGAIDEGAWYVADGYEQPAITDSMGRVGYFIVTGDDRATALERAERAYARLEAMSPDGDNLIFWPGSNINRPSTV